MKYKYSATHSNDQDKTPQHGVVEAESIDAARRILSKQGLEAYRIQKDSQKNGADRQVHFGRVSRTDIVLFTKNISVMMKAGLTLAESLHISIDQARGKLRGVLSEVLRHVENGDSFSKSISSQRRYFPKLYQDIVNVGEVSGSLDDNLEYLANQLAKDRDINRKVWGAMIYPLFIIFGIGGLGILLSTIVFPRLARLFRSLDVELPLPTRVLIKVSEGLESYGLWVLLVVIMLIIAAIFLYKIKPIKYIVHYIILHLPIFGRISHQINVTRFSRALGALLTSGLPITKSLEAVHDTVGNEVYRLAITRVHADVLQGAKITTSLEKFPRLFPRIVTRMIHVGESSGRLEEILLYLADFYEEEFDEIAKNLTVMIEPILLICIGVAVGFIGLSIITPIYQITSAIG